MYLEIIIPIAIAMFVVGFALGAAVDAEMGKVEWKETETVVMCDECGWVQTAMTYEGARKHAAAHVDAQHSWDESVGFDVWL